MVEYDNILATQFALDYHCKAEDFSSTDTLVTEYAFHPNARKRADCGLLSILSYCGKLVITAAPALKPWCEETLAKHISAQWCFEAGSLIGIDRKLAEFGYGIDQAHLFFVPRFPMPREEYPVKIIGKAEIAALEEDERIDEAFLFQDYIEDILGAACYDENGALLAVAGATANSELMWEMGVNSFSEGRGYAKAALAALTNEICKQGKLPFYGTALSHIASQNLALRIGLVPAFAELTTIKLD
ncbi:MAG: GNAT family N-acetyltransferase [Faecousia sp.]